MQRMSYFSDKLNEHLEASGLNPYRFIKLVKERGIRLSEQYLYRLFRGEVSPKEKTIAKLAQVQELNASEMQMLAWRLLDDYGPEAAAQAIQENPRAREIAQKILKEKKE